MASIAVAPELVGRPPRRIELSAILMTVLLAVVAFLILFPLIQIVLQSFQVSKPGEVARWGLEGWRAVFTEGALQKAAWNTVSLAVVRQVAALVFAVFIAWLLARTDVPGAKIFEFVFWLAFFLPALTVTLSWILLLDPQFGLVNQGINWALAQSGLPPLGTDEGKIGVGPLNIYSFWGIVWVHLVGTSIAIKVMILTPAFRNMNSAFEEASRVSGAGNIGTLIRIFIPLMLPIIIAVEFLALLNALSAFEIEQILGTPIGLYVFSTWIYDTLYQHIPRYDAVSALAVVFVVAATGLIFMQRFLIQSRQYTTITGQFQSQKLKLGRLKWFAFAFLLVTAFIIIAVPMIFSVMGTFMKLFGFFIEEPWTLKQWQTALNDRLLGRALGNTIQLALGTAFAAIFLHSLIAYVIVRTRFYARGALDFISWLPIALPGIILSLGLLTMFLQPMFRIPFPPFMEKPWFPNGFYGTMVTLVLALVISGAPLAVQVMKSNLMQLGNELEEASRVSGGSWWYTYRRIVLPLISPTLVVIGVISFISAARNIAQVALLSNTAIRPLSIMQLDYIAEGKYEVAAVIATILLFVSVILALIARKFGYRSVG